MEGDGAASAHATGAALLGVEMILPRCAGYDFAILAHAQALCV